MHEVPGSNCHDVMIGLECTLRRIYFVTYKDCK